MIFHLTFPPPEQSSARPIRTGFLRGVILLLLMGCCSLMGCHNVRSGRPPDGRNVWFHDLRNSAPPDDDVCREVALRVIKMARKGDTDLADEFLGDDIHRTPSIVFLSLSDGRTPARVSRGSGMRADTAGAAALRNAVPYLMEEGFEPRWIKLDFVSGVTGDRELGTDDSLEISPDHMGVAFSADTDVALLPGEAGAHGILNRSLQVQPDALLTYLKRQNRPWKALQKRMEEDDLSAYRFGVEGHAAIDGQELTTLSFGFAEPPRELDRETLLGRARKAGEYLVDATADNGKFHYLYDPGSDRVEDDYNLVRHAGTMYSLYQLAGVTEDKELIRTADRAADYLFHYLESAESFGQEGSVIVSPDSIKLGTQALAVLAIAERARISGEDKYLQEGREIAEWICSTQQEDGRFRIHKQLLPDGDVTSFRSSYYPGEAIFGLMRMYQVDGNERWAETAESAARYLIEDRDADKTDLELPPDHWLLYGLQQVHDYSPDELYIEHAWRIASTMLANQHRPPMRRAWRGGFHRPPRSGPTATRSEGLSAAFWLQHRAGHEQRAERIVEGIRAAVRFQLHTQHTPASTMHFPDPQRPLGAFAYSLRDSRVRIDIVQHNISSLVRFRQILSEISQ
ncbi:MAG: hypothetical protein ACLFT2_01395 [Candidatus Brocadiia bacterium]